MTSLWLRLAVLVLGVGLLVFLGQEYAQKRQFLAKARASTGTLVENRKDLGYRGGRRSIPVVRFVDHRGGVQTFQDQSEFRLWFPRSIGEPVPVLYDPSLPRQAIINTWWNRYGMLWFGLYMGLFALYMGLSNPAAPGSRNPLRGPLEWLASGQHPGRRLAAGGTVFVLISLTLALVAWLQWKGQPAPPPTLPPRPMDCNVLEKVGMGEGSKVVYTDGQGNTREWVGTWKNPMPPPCQPGERATWFVTPDTPSHSAAEMRNRQNVAKILAGVGLLVFSLAAVLLLDAWREYAHHGKAQQGKARRRGA